MCFIDDFLRRTWLAFCRVFLTVVEVCAFSCRRRGFCPSGLGRRMTDMALNLVEQVLPDGAPRPAVGELVGLAV